MPAPVKAPLIHLPPDSKLGLALERMLLRQQLLQKFHSHRITIEEFNQQLSDGGIEMIYQPGKGFIHLGKKTLV